MLCQFLPYCRKRC